MGDGNDRMTRKVEQLIESIANLSFDVVDDVVDLDFAANNFVDLFEASYEVSLSKDSFKGGKSCLLEWNDTSHQCDLDKLVNYFAEHKPGEISISFSKVAHLLNQVRCLSKLPKIVTLFGISKNEPNTLPKIVSFVKELIECCDYNRAIILILHFDIRDSVPFTKLLLKLLFEDIHQQIVFCLRLEDIAYDETKLTGGPVPPPNSDEYFLFDFLTTLEEIFTNVDKLVDFNLAKHIKKNGKSGTTRHVINSFLFGLLKHRAFDQISDETFLSICPNILQTFYFKTIDSILYQLRRSSDDISLNVIVDHVNLFPIKNQLPKVHAEVMSILTSKINALHLARAYAEHYNLLHLVPQVDGSIHKSTFTKACLVNGSVQVVDDHGKFRAFLAKVMNMTTISIDTEWRHNFFSIRPKTRVSIMQIANDHECFIIDCLQLARHDASMAFLRQIVEQIFRNASILKLGYSIDDDLRMIAKTIEQATGRKISMDENRSVVDMRSLYEFVVRSPSYRNLLASSNLEESRSTRGLSQLTTLLLGSTIDKQEQLSDWERRPLRSSQINYAAIDACCLIDCYHSFSKLLHKKMNITFDEFIAGPFSNPKFKFSDPETHVDAEVADETLKMPINQFRCVVDTMLWGIIKYLRICNADALKADNHEAGARLAASENRYFITTGSVYDHYKKRIPLCLHLNNTGSASSQFGELVTKYELTVRMHDLFVRCRFCNAHPFVIVSRQEFNKHLDTYQRQPKSPEGDASLLPKFAVKDLDSRHHVVMIDFDKFLSLGLNDHHHIDRFYLCNTCGQVFWEGTQTIHFIDSIKALITE